MELVVRCYGAREVPRWEHRLRARLRLALARGRGRPAHVLAWLVDAGAPGAAPDLRCRLVLTLDGRRHRAVEGQGADAYAAAEAAVAELARAALTAHPARNGDCAATSSR